MPALSEPYIETVSGKKLTFLNPHPDHIDIKDIAYALSNQCRFNGHVPFYSVAEHSVMVSSMLSEEQALAGLLHDAAEAYLSDLPSPIKDFLPDYNAMEKTVQDAINLKFGVDTYIQEVKFADKRATWSEAWHLLESRGQDWIPALFIPDKKHKPYQLPPNEAYRMFMTVFTHLTKSKIVLV